MHLAIIVCSFQWLKDEFLGYLKEWEDSVSKREGFTKKEKNNNDAEL